MANRTWLAVALCCMVWFVYMRWFAPEPLAPITPPPAATSTSDKPTVEATPGTIPVSQAKIHWANLPSQEKTSFSQLENALLLVRFSDADGDIWDAQVKKYKTTLNADAGFVTAVERSRSNPSLRIHSNNDSIEKILRTVPQKKQTEKSIEYIHTLNGNAVHKIYSWSSSSPYIVDVNYQFSATPGFFTGHLILPVGGRKLHYDANQPLDSWEVVQYQNQSLTRHSLDSLGEEKTSQGDSKWIVFGNRYFFASVINLSDLNPDIHYGKYGDFSGTYFQYPILSKQTAKDFSLKVQYFLGSKETEYLAAVPGMKGLVDYGSFSFLAFPLLELLKFFFKYVQNYGVAIILLTLLVRAVFYPLSMKSFASMKEMQKLQPEIAALKEKYKDDTKKFGEAQMALFKTHKVNPLGGCLPLLVQLPVFIALYAVLANSIELFHAPFFGWVKDLSAKDPFYIFPVLMGISMFLQQKMMPTPGMDPTQQKIMLIMPVVFSFMMISLPSGLTIYIFLSTILGVIQQLAMNRKSSTSNVATVV